MSGQRQITFYTSKELWLKFSKKALDLGQSKTKILNEMIEKFLKEK